MLQEQDGGDDAQDAEQPGRHPIAKGSIAVTLPLHKRRGIAHLRGVTEPLALYIHWPFCLAKCPYCDFNSHVRDVIPQARFARALRAELAWEAARLGRRRLRSIFFGGGTPSLMEPGAVADLIEDARRLFDAAPELEVTLEANPTSVERGRLAAFREAGVNRASLGVQSLQAEALRFLGRQHSAGEATRALEVARGIFPRISFDLIYARPGQSRPAWREELGQALALGGEHLSLYQLTIEPGTAFEAQHRQGGIVLPDGELAAALYRDTIDAAARFGMRPYEVSNFAVPGQESRHNLAYWRYDDYAGIGAGAHGRLTLRGRTVATRRHRAPEPWASRVERDGHGSHPEAALLVHERAVEMLMMGLRLAEGIELSRFEARTGLGFASVVCADVLAQAIEAGYLEVGGGRVAATLEGRLRLDALLAALLDVAVPAEACSGPADPLPQPA